MPSTHTRARTHARRRTHADARTHIHTYAQARTHTHARARTHSVTHTRTRTHARMQARKPEQASKHAPTRKHAHTYSLRPAAVWYWCSIPLHTACAVTERRPSRYGLRVEPELRRRAARHAQSRPVFPDGVHGRPRLGPVIDQAASWHSGNEGRRRAGGPARRLGASRCGS